MSERSDLIAWIRGELAGPSRSVGEARRVEFTGLDFVDNDPKRRGPIVWRPTEDLHDQEVLYYERETPHRKYGIGLLHPLDLTNPQFTPPDQAAALSSDTLGGIERSDDELAIEGALNSTPADDWADDSGDDFAQDIFNISSPDIRHPSSIGISFCVSLAEDGKVIIKLPQSKLFSWQRTTDSPYLVNGRYEKCVRRYTDIHGAPKEQPIWRRRSAVPPDTTIEFTHSEISIGQPVAKEVQLPPGSPLGLRLKIWPRRRKVDSKSWLITAVLVNVSPGQSAVDEKEGILYQSYFEVSVNGGRIEQYPENCRPFSRLDPDEQSLALLYRESATWGIGHGCAAGWEGQPTESPEVIFADIMPAVELPSMTPDIKDAEGQPIKLSMRSLASLPDDGSGAAWDSLRMLASEYRLWINQRRDDALTLPTELNSVAMRHLDACEMCLSRIETGIRLVREDSSVRRAFKLANLAMLLQQISTKSLSIRPLTWDPTCDQITPLGPHVSPWAKFENHTADERAGAWRAFQIAFLLMSIQGLAQGDSSDREIVDLIWFPTGGGKTEAYLGATAFHLFHERLLISEGESPRRDGTNVLMRYTLRMLTTQQFQRAASLICAMEFLRRFPQRHHLGAINGNRFSLGLWIGRDGSPNNIKEARTKVGTYRRASGDEGTPLVLTECPWCRASIGRYDGPKPTSIRKLSEHAWNAMRVRGIGDDPKEGPLLHCPDGSCPFGAESTKAWLPIEVIDERIFNYPPSLVIATADKLAMIAYRPNAGALFGRVIVGGERRQAFMPPSLIIQDELHLIAGPLGTMYGLYEGIFEQLCSVQRPSGKWIKPKLIASTATIRGAKEQVKALYAREQLQLFPSPGLLMGDSFFGEYAREDASQTLQPGRLYLGIHANDYGSILTSQVRAFSSALFRPYAFDTSRRDPWWTFLVFYNSIRELGMAKTLFDSDIRSRLWFLSNRENVASTDRRVIRGSPEELTSRLSQPEIVGMLEKLSTEYQPTNNSALDACLASNIIEVGIDIERLSLMAVVGQPKTTAQYIQVTGRVGRKWWERAGLILTIFNPSNSRDRSHFEQFHSYHRRLYERVEPTSVTPFALAAIQRALPGALIAWARQHVDAYVSSHGAHALAIEEGFNILRSRCEAIQSPEDLDRSLLELERVRQELETKWGMNPVEWGDQFPPNPEGEYLMLWPGQYASLTQKARGVVIPSSMRQVDGSAELNITQGYAQG